MSSNSSASWKESFVEARRQTSIISKWLHKKLKIRETNMTRGRLYPQEDMYSNYSWLYVKSCYFDEGADEFSSPEDRGFHVDLFITCWNGPLKINGITEISREVRVDIYGHALGTDYNIIITSEKLIRDLQSIYLADAFRGSVQT